MSHDLRTGIRVIYEPPEDTLTFRFQERGTPAEMLHPARGLTIAFDDRRRLVSVAIRGASFHVPRPLLDAFVVAEEYLTTGEAARIAGVSPVMLRQRIHCAHLQATKRGRDWFVHRRDLEEFLKGPRYRDWDIL